MANFLAGFHLEFISFAIGFITALLFMWAIGQARILFPRAISAIRNAINAGRKREISEIEERIRRETIRRASGMHLAASLFSLEEILIPPTLLAPPRVVVPGSSDNPDEDELLAIPYLPDWPEMICQLTVPRLSLVEVMQSPVNFAIIGQPGSGKTVALAHLAIQVARRDPQAGVLASLVPVFIHAGDLDLQNEGQRDPMTLVAESASNYLPALLSPQLLGFLRNAALEETLLLILDGGDELSQPQMKELGVFIKTLLAQNKKIRLVMSAAPDFLDGLVRLGIVPLAMAAWNTAQRLHFVDHWGILWKEQIQPLAEKSSPISSIDPVLLNSWLSAGSQIQSPLELTLKVWAAYLGDAYGPHNTDAIDSFLHRVIPDFKLLAPLEQLALQMVLVGQATISRSQITDPNPAVESGAIFDNGLLLQRQHNGIAFAHPVLMGYLASQVIVDSGKLEVVAGHQAWAGKDLVLHYLSSQHDMTSIIEPMLEKCQNDLVMRDLFIIAHWLKDVPAGAGWRTTVMRQLLVQFQRENAPFSLRSRALAALVCSNDPSVILLLRDQLLHSSATIRHLAVLGAGALQDSKSFRELVALLADPDRAVRQAVCYTLLAFNTRQAIEVVNEIMKQGNEELSRLVAEGLAMRPEIGYRLLREGSATENLMARRAVIFGLARVPDQWAVEILQKMCIEDGQWVVRNAAAQALDDRKKLNPYVSRPLPPPHESPWLITFASKLGRGISPRQPVIDLLLQAIKSGNSEEQIASLDYLRQAAPDAGALRMLYRTMIENDSRLGDDIFYTLWLYASCGYSLPTLQELETA